jgi:hypothetical protein
MRAEELGMCNYNVHQIYGWVLHQDNTHWLMLWYIGEAIPDTKTDPFD